MLFYPHNISTNITVANSVSSSLTVTSSYIANFAAIPVNLINTASFAANITGSPGTNGTNASPIKGPTGQKGDQGVQGPRGLNMWLLSSSWADGCTGGGVVCYTITTLNKYSVATGCSDVSAGTIYTTRVNIAGGLEQDLSPIYTDPSCTTKMPSGSRLGHDGAIAYVTNANSTASFLASCGPAS